MTVRSITRALPPLFVAALIGCGSTSPVLSNLSSVDPGDACANGGITFETGSDENDDGVLSADEITASETVCNGTDGTNGTDGSSALIVTTALDFGDADCPDGGSRIDAGIDDNADGTLQEGEIDATEFVCNGASGGQQTIPVDAPDGPAGQFTINMSGGEGLLFDGGDGGDVDMELEYGSIGGGIRIFNTGVANADWTYPASVSFDLGDNPAVIDADTTITDIQGNTAGLTVGDLYIDSGTEGGLRSYVYEWDGTRGTQGSIITGLHITTGNTLTFEAGTDTTLAIQFESDFVVDGTLTTALDGTVRPSLDIDLDNFIGGATGLVDLSGADSTTGTGGDAGTFAIDAEDDDYDFEEDFGAIFNQATIDLSGGNGTSGGDGGELSFDAQYHLYNTANITTTGGNGSDGRGGSAGDINLDNDYAHNFNSGTLNASGGTGDGGSGGDGGQIYFYNGYYGFVYNTGDLIADGGDALNCISCSGGDADSVEWVVYANPVSSTGTISLRGGSAPLTTRRGESDTYGESGGDLDYESDYESGWSLADYVPVGDFTLSGNIDMSGGSGDFGGDGGDLTFDMDVDYVPDNQIIGLYGYTDIDISGGNGADDGGEGGYMTLFADYADADYPVDYGPGGAIANYANIDGRGGDGASGSGGDTEYVEFRTEDEYGMAAPWQVVVNAGDIDISGGTGGDDDGGDAGTILMFGYNGVENSGDLTANGGDSTDGGDGGCAGCETYDEWDYGIFLFADNGPLSNSGTLSLAGGSALGADYSGGDVERIEIVGATVINSGDIFANGGDATNDGFGGDNDEGVLIMSLYGFTEQTGTIIDVSGGLGGTENANGTGAVVILDGQNVTADYAATTTR